MFDPSNKEKSSKLVDKLNGNGKNFILVSLDDNPHEKENPKIDIIYKPMPGSSSVALTPKKRIVHLSEFPSNKKIPADKHKKEIPNGWWISSSLITDEIMENFRPMTNGDLEVFKKEGRFKASGPNQDQNPQMSSQVADITSDVFGAGAQGGYMSGFKT